MTITGIISAILIGVVVGVLGRLVVPGKQRIGMLLTILVGVVAAFLGTALARAMGIPTATSGVDWLELLVQVVVAALGVALVAGLTGRRRSGILRRHYYLYSGYVFRLDNGIDLKPSVLLKYQPQAPLQADLNMNIWFKDLFSCGFSYRTNDAVSVMVEIPLGKKLSVGYAFDNTISNLQQVSAGTHEIMLGYNFTDEVQWKDPRRF